MRVLVSGGTKSLRSFTARWPECFGRLLTPANGNSVASIVESGLPWAVDNGAFSGFDAEKFRGLVSRVEGQPRLLWVAVPDVVADAAETMRRFDEWEELRGRVPLAFVLQDGCESGDVPWSEIAAVFVGGSTEFKLSEKAEKLVRVAKSRGLQSHMGRVNSLRRLRHAAAIGCDTVDGTAVSMFGDVYLPKFGSWLRMLSRERRLF